jgi:hypothetical protein
MMSLKRIAVIAVAVPLGGALMYFYAGHATPAGQPPLSELRPANFTVIKDAFNAATGDARVLILLSPT